MRHEDLPESWLVEAGDAVIQKKADGGENSLSPWEKLVYCFWVADYGMRNAGDLDTAQDVYAGFLTEARRTAEKLSLRLSYQAFSLSRRVLQREYFERFDAMCNEIRSAEPGSPPRGGGK